ncbi:MAG: SOS response-associated peptidase [Aeromicrobium sp.]
MCGRYATTLTAAAMNTEFEIDLAHSLAEVEPDYNMAPTKLAPIVVQRTPRDADPYRELMRARWGLIPSWAKDPSIGSRMINARVETVAEKPAFQKAFRKRRALIPADGYYEWYAGQGKSKQPFFMTPKDRSVLSMAGLYEFWKDPETDEWVVSYTIMTARAEDALGYLHDRMPFIVEKDSYTQWLDPAPQPTEELLGLLVPAAPGRLDAFPVSKAVGNYRNNGPELIEPLPPE